jgi:hypothetical protein
VSHSGCTSDNSAFAHMVLYVFRMIFGINSAIGRHSWPVRLRSDDVNVYCEVGAECLCTFLNEFLNVSHTLCISLTLSKHDVT